MHASKILTVFTLTLTATAGVLLPREDRSKDGIYNEKGRITGLPKRSVNTDGISNIESKRSAEADNETTQALEARKEHWECHNQHYRPIALKVEYQEEASNALIGFCKQDGNKNSCDQSIWARAGDVTVYYCMYHGPGKFEEKQLKYSLSKIAGECREGFAGNIGDDGFAYGVTRNDIEGVCYFDVGYDG
ncbi:hypothetical protein PG994_005036 [Apiospora phragmitis]|uniref:Uncharacterized protein n=1 Tax=Apiospora phragmitis TaxID=2905665 RepID=A0ABR1VTI5_9PEZI